MSQERRADHLSFVPEVAREIGRHLACVREEWADHSLGIGEQAERLGVLPLLLDMGGFIGVTGDGDLVQVTWDAPDVVVPVRNLRIRDLAIVAGAKRYPALAAFLPEAAAGTGPCPTCGGTGVHPATDGAAAVVCVCGGLGWIPSDWESA